MWFEIFAFIVIGVLAVMIVGLAIFGYLFWLSECVSDERRLPAFIISLVLIVISALGILEGAGAI